MRRGAELQEPRTHSAPLAVFRSSISRCEIVREDRLPPILRASPNNRRLSATQRAGLKYEEQVLQRFQGEADQIGGEMMPKPWFQIRDEGTDKLRQPDFVLVLPEKKVLVGEVKLRLTRRGCIKLRQQYMPMMQVYFGPAYQIFGALICHWFDRTELLPGYTGTENPLSLEHVFSYHIWNPRYVGREGWDEDVLP